MPKRSAGPVIPFYFRAPADVAEAARKRAEELNLTMTDYLIELIKLDIEGKVERK